MDVFRGFDVSRETVEKLELYVALLEKWSPKINLVAKSTLDDIWHRHILDSLQLAALLRGESGSYVDLGSGGGLPALVVALTKTDLCPSLTELTLVESDQRKSAFLRTVLRETSTQAAIIPKRIEQIDPLNADILSARALAPLPRLLEFAERHMKPTGYAYFLKGQNWQKEVDDAQRSFSFQNERHRSLTQDGSVILKIGDISRV